MFRFKDLSKSLCNIAQLNFFFSTETLCKKLEEDARIAAEARAVTGVLGY
jgi:hypothetical protein